MSDAPKHRRILFNWDGGPLAFGEYPMSKEEFLNYIFAPFENSQVDVISWCVGDVLVDYPSRLGNTFADMPAEVTASSPQRYRLHMNAKRLMERGEEPLKIIAEEGHKRGKDVFAAIRLNDIHDGIPFREKPVVFERLAPIKREHPEWLLGHSRRYRLPTAFNYALRDVRDWWLDRVCEPFERYDLDGVELDFCRKQAFFADRHEYRHRYLLTDWMSAVRGRLNELAAKRGRPIEVAIRVDETLEACLLDGFDVPAWIEEQLFDILILGTGTIEHDVPRFKELVKSTPILVYPCVYGWAHGQFFGPKADEELRADAARCLYQGADGIYCFNMFPVVERTSAEQSVSTGVFRTMGTLETLRNTNKRYQVGQGRPVDPAARAHNDLWGMLPVELHTTQTTRGPQLRLLVADDVRAAEETGKIAKLALRFRFANVSATDSIEFSLNGKRLAVTKRFHPMVLKAHGTPLVDAAGQEWYELEVPRGVVRQGWNQVTLLLQARTQLAVPLKLEEACLTIEYGG